MLLLNYESLEPVVKPKLSDFPPVGSYFSKIVEVHTEIVISLDNSEGFCLTISYRLTNISTGDQYDFIETYCLLKANPRICEFEAYLNEYGFDTSMDDDLIGIYEQVEITHEFLGGFAYPMICKRRFISQLSD